MDKDPYATKSLLEYMKFIDKAVKREDHIAIQGCIAISLKRIADNLDKDRAIEETPSYRKIVRVMDND